MVQTATEKKTLFENNGKTMKMFVNKLKEVERKKENIYKTRRGEILNTFGFVSAFHMWNITASHLHVYVLISNIIICSDFKSSFGIINT